LIAGSAQISLKEKTTPLSVRRSAICGDPRLHLVRQVWCVRSRQLPVAGHAALP
jgi:hypothetical protein